MYGDVSNLMRILFYNNFAKQNPLRFKPTRHYCRDTVEGTENTKRQGEPGTDCEN